jgi:hypothetical protein
MRGELNIAGLFVPWLFVWMLAAMLELLIVRRLLYAARFYRWVWHPALFDFGLFIVLLGGTTALTALWAY